MLMAPIQARTYVRTATVTGTEGLKPAEEKPLAPFSGVYPLACRSHLYIKPSVSDIRYAMAVGPPTNVKRLDIQWYHCDW